MATAQNNLDLSNQQFNNKQKLYTQGVASRNELVEAKKEVNGYEQNIKVIRNSIDEYDGRILQLQKNIMELKCITPKKF